MIGHFDALDGESNNPTKKMLIYLAYCIDNGFSTYFGFHFSCFISSEIQNINV